MSEQEVEATPAAEAKAEELGVPLEEVEGSGVEGRVLVTDVEEAAQTDAPQATTQGDIVPDADEHPVDTTPPPSPDAPSPPGGPTGDAHESMVHEPGEPNERRLGGGDGTVWNG